MEFDQGKLLVTDFNVEFLNLKEEIKFLVMGGDEQWKTRSNFKQLQKFRFKTYLRLLNSTKENRKLRGWGSKNYKQLNINTWTSQFNTRSYDHASLAYF